MGVKNQEFKIETVDEQLLELVLPLIAQYQIFYGAQPDISANRVHFSQVINDPSMGILFVALNSERSAVGFATLYFIPASVTPGRTCLLNDIFCREEMRGLGIGYRLSEHCRDYAAQKGFNTLEWYTHHDNINAQKLYDRIGATRSPWFNYVLEVK